MPRWSLLALWALGCQGAADPADGGADGDTDTDTDTEEDGRPELRMSVSDLDLGEVDVGDLAEVETHRVDVDNIGTDELVVTSLAVEGTSAWLVDFGIEGSISVDPGESLTVWLALEPEEPGEVDATLIVETEEGGDGWTRLTGKVLGPELSVDPEQLVFGTVPWDCSASAGLTLENTGNQDLTLLQASLSADQGELSLLSELTEDTTLAPGEVLELTLEWTAAASGPHTGSLLIESDDPVTGELLVPLSLEAEALEEGSQTFTEVFPVPVDLLVHVDKSAYDQTLHFAEESGELLAPLRDAGSAHQVAVVVEDSGCVLGDALFVDGSFDESDAVDTLEAMLGLGSSYGTTWEQGFTALEAALAETGSGGCNEGLLRPEADLGLLLISDEPEQSEQNWETWLASVRTHVPYEDQLEVHAIGAEPPSSCTGAQAFTGAWDASLETGGEFGDLCTQDMATLLGQLGEALATEDPALHLAEEPVAATLSVELDGDLLDSSAWSWDAGQQALVLDATALPDSVSEAVVRYDLPGSCD